MNYKPKANNTNLNVAENTSPAAHESAEEDKRQVEMLLMVKDEQDNGIGLYVGGPPDMPRTRHYFH